MKLSNREMEMLLKIPKGRRDRKLGAWLGMATALAAFLVTHFFDLYTDSLGPLLAVLVGMSTAELARAYFRAEPEDTLMDLVQRYVNNDAEAVQQLASKLSPGSLTA